MVGRPTLHSLSGTHTPNSSPCRHTERLRVDDCGRAAVHRSHSVRIVWPQRLSRQHLDPQLLIFRMFAFVSLFDPNGRSTALDSCQVVHMVGSLLVSCPWFSAHHLDNQFQSHDWATPPNQPTLAQSFPPSTSTTAATQLPHTCTLGLHTDIGPAFVRTPFLARFLP